MHHEIGEDIEDLRFQCDETSSVPQFIALGVEAILVECIAHCSASSPQRELGAHRGLWCRSRKSPEAIRWIVDSMTPNLSGCIPNSSL
jgi:hypothetical protein